MGSVTFFIGILVLLSVVLLFLSVLIFLFKKKKPDNQVIPPKSKVLDLRKAKENPIIRPKNGNGWENGGVFNPAALKIDGKTHLLYRAVGSDGASRVGYAESKDGINFKTRSPYPVFALENPGQDLKEGLKKYDFNLYPSGGSWGGCEDPRAVLIEDKIYMTFNAFSDWGSIRVGLTSLKKKDFLDKNWKWKKPMFISPAKQVNKNWVVFPEKINGKFAILHSISPKVQVDYVNNFEELANGKKVIKSVFGQKVPRKEWDTFPRGAGSPPIKTKEGWLVLYHATNKNEPQRYKLGALLLDLKDPTKVIGRSSAPLLAPNEWYENDWKPGIVYTCGATVAENNLNVYYGGGDKYTCLAIGKLSDLLKDLTTQTISQAFSFKKLASV